MTARPSVAFWPTFRWARGVVPFCAHLLEWFDPCDTLLGELTTNRFHKLLPSFHLHFRFLFFFYFTLPVSSTTLFVTFTAVSFAPHSLGLGYVM